MTEDAYRVGLFGFESNKAARGAAQHIDDPGVSHIFVSGNVLIVEEENSPSVYSTLLGYAEEVRTPLLETPAQSDEEPRKHHRYRRDAARGHASADAQRVGEQDEKRNPLSLMTERGFTGEGFSRSIAPYTPAKNQQTS